jgi:hypothetical protein
LATYLDSLLGARALPHRPGDAVTISGFRGGSVLRPGESLALLRAKNAVLAQALVGAVDRTDLQICFCSILDQCWIAALRDPGEPHAIGHCNERDPSGLQSLDAAAMKRLSG